VVPQLLVVAMLGAGLYAGYRWLARASRQMVEELQRAQDDMQRRTAGAVIEKDLGALEYDPATGVYRPAKRRG
jgi:hypothetical protein